MLIQGALLSEKWRKRVKTGKHRIEAGQQASRHPAGFHLALVATLVLVAACGRSTDIAELAPTTAIDPSTTASVENTAIVASDKQIIASAIRDVKTGAETSGDTMVLAWSNDKTGNSGTITAIEKAISDDGERCFSFLTTLENYTGISLYDGKACELSAGQWVLSWFKPKSVG